MGQKVKKDMNKCLSLVKSMTDHKVKKHINKCFLRDGDIKICKQKNTMT